MKVVLTGPAPEKKIHAIKAVRGATGLGLKEAKEAIEVVERGGETTVTVTNVIYLSELEENGVRYRVQPVPMQEIVATLRDYPAHLTVGDLVAVLSVAAFGAPADAIAVSQQNEPRDER